MLGYARAYRKSQSEVKVAVINRPVPARATMKGPGAGVYQTATAILNDLSAIERSTCYLSARAITEND